MIPDLKDYETYGAYMGTELITVKFSEHLVEVL